MIRSDLPDGVRESQIVHASGESAALYAWSVGGPLPKATRSVVLAVKTEDALLATAERLKAAGIIISLIQESEGDYAGQYMALGVVPAVRDEVSKHLSSLPLFRGKK